MPSQSPDVFEKFSDNFELNLDKIANKNQYLIVILGEFNAKSSNWYEHDMTRYKGSKINAITSQFGLKQLIQGPKVFYPPPHEHEIWHYHCANADQIQQAIEQFSWEKAFRNLNINEMVVLFKKTIKFFFSKFIPHGTGTFDDRDPPWFNNNIKQIIQKKNNIYIDVIF